MIETNYHANRDRIVYTAQGSLADAGEVNDVANFTIWAPRGYKVVLAGYSFNSLESGQILASNPQYNAENGTGQAASSPDNQEGWTWQWKILDTGGQITLNMICERNEGLTIEVPGLNACPIGL